MPGWHQDPDVLANELGRVIAEEWLHHRVHTVDHAVLVDCDDRVDGSLEGRFEKLRVNLGGGWDYAETDGDLSTRKTFGQLRIAWTLSGDFYAYGRLRLESDEFQDLTLRTILGAGFGYRFIETDDTTFDVAVGASWVDEDNDGFTLQGATRVGNEDRAYATADGTVTFRQKITDGIVFTEDILAFQSLKDGDDFRAISTSALKFAITGSLAATPQLLHIETRCSRACWTASDSASLAVCAMPVGM